MHGAEDDVRELGAHLADYLARSAMQLSAGLGRSFPVLEENHERYVVRHQ